MSAYEEPEPLEPFVLPDEVVAAGVEAAGVEAAGGVAAGVVTVGVTGTTDNGAGVITALLIVLKSIGVFVELMMISSPGSSGTHALTCSS